MLILIRSCLTAASSRHDVWTTYRLLAGGGSDAEERAIPGSSSFLGVFSWGRHPAPLPILKQPQGRQGPRVCCCPGKKVPTLQAGRLAGWQAEQVGWCGLLALGSSCCPEDEAYVSPLVAWLLAAVFLRQTRFRGSGRLGEGSFFVHDQPMRW